MFDPQGLRPGDVVLERGNTWRSTAIAIATGGRFSHALIWVGGTDFSIQKMQAAGRPTQHLYSLAPNEGIGWNLDLFLDDAPKLRDPNEMGARVMSEGLPSIENPIKPTRR